MIDYCISYSLTEPLPRPKKDTNTLTYACFIALLFFQACTLPYDLSKRSCLYNGDCIQVIVNGQRAELLQDPKFVEEYKGIRESDYYFHLPQTISGEIVVESYLNDKGSQHLGKKESQKVKIIPLQEVHVATTVQSRASPNVQVGGRAVNTAENVMTEHWLPDGKYVMQVYHYTTDGWDVQVVYFEVSNKEHDPSNSAHQTFETNKTLNTDSIVELHLMATSSIAQLDDEQLPKFNSSDPSNTFAKVHSMTELLIRLLDDESISVNERMQISLRTIPPIATLLTRYAHSLSSGRSLSYETAILQGLGFAFAAQAAELGDQFAETLDTNDPSYETRLAGLNQLKRGGMTLFDGMLLSLTKQEIYHENDRKNLANYLSTYGPTFFQSLDSEDQKELKLKLSAHIDSESNSEVHQSLIEFLRNTN